MQQHDAQQLAELSLQELADRSGLPLQLILEETVRLDEGWVFFWGPKNPDDLLAGGGPFFVTRNRKVHDLPGWQSWEKSVQEVLKKGKN
jgi:hypothetical protein